MSTFHCRILELCRKIPKGINDQTIQNDMPQFDAKQRVMAINRLLSTVSDVCLVVYCTHIYVFDCLRNDSWHCVCHEELFTVHANEIRERSTAWCIVRALRRKMGTKICIRLLQRASCCPGDS